MNTMLRHINPDHYLQTPEGRVWTEERGKEAWESAYAELERALSELGRPGAMYLVCGLQGSGKTTWINANATRLNASAIFFDAALPAKKHRRRALDLAAIYQVSAVGVWLNTPIEIALQRNLKRPIDQRISEQTIRHVHGLLEPPSLEEGFAHIIVITPSANDA
jgi:predicted kinase